MSQKRKGFGPTEIPYSLVCASIWGFQFVVLSMIPWGSAWAAIIASLSANFFLAAAIRDPNILREGVIAIAVAAFVVLSIPIFGRDAIDKLLAPLGGMTAEYASGVLLWGGSVLSAVGTIAKAALHDITERSQQHQGDMK